MKDLINLLTFRKLYHYQPRIDFADVLSSILIWMLIITTMIFLIKGVQLHRQLNRVAPEKKPVSYHYDVITSTEKAYFFSQDKMMLSERGNIIDMNGGIHFENAKSIRLIKTVY